MKRIIVGITGATGALYGISLLRQLQTLNIETHLIISPWGKKTLQYETHLTTNDLTSLVQHIHAPNDMESPLASGSFRTMGMIIVPCSVNTLAGVAQGRADSLMLRAADVILKERRRLVLMVRETPLNLMHIRNMETVTLAGGVITTPAPSLYTHPKHIDEMVQQTTGRLLDLFDLEVPIPRWGETLPKSK